MSAHRKALIPGLALPAALFITLWIAGCSAGRAPGMPTRPVEVTAPVVVTRVVVQTSIVVQTAMVTPTPTPPPAYVSRLAAPANTLRYALATSPQTFDPQAARDQAEVLVTGQIFEGLYNLRMGGALAPAAATDFQAAPDGRVYTVTLRSGLVWSDGRPLGAPDFVAGVCRLLDPAQGNPAGYLLTEVAQVTGARDYASGAQPDCGRVGVRALDERRLQITLDQPFAAFPQLLASRAFLPAPPPGAPGPGATTTLQAGNGPYLLAEWQPGDHVTLVKNPLYWGADAVAITRLELPILITPAMRQAAYEAGNLHVVDAGGEAMAHIQPDGGLRAELQQIVQPGTSFLALNTAGGATANADFRRALASAIDRQELLTDTLHEPWHLPAHTLLPPGIQAFQGQDPTVGYRFDPQAVKDFLARAGYASGATVPVIKLWANREGHNQELALGLAAAFERAGIPTRLTLSGWDDYQRSLQACTAAGTAAALPAATPGPDCDYNAYLLGWMLDVPDPARLLEGTPALAYTHWAPEAYTDRLAQARGQADAAQRAALYRQAEKQLLNEAVVIPLFHYGRPILVKPGLLFEYPAVGPPHFQYWQLPAQAAG